MTSALMNTEQEEFQAFLESDESDVQESSVHMHGINASQQHIEETSNMDLGLVEDGQANKMPSSYARAVKSDT